MRNVVAALHVAGALVSTSGEACARTRPLRLGLSVVAIAVALAACGGARQAATSTPISTPSLTEVKPSEAPSVSELSSASPSARVFASTRHGYRVEVPPGWVVNEYGGSWESLSQFTPGGEIPGEDVVAPTDLRAFLVMDSMAIPPGMTASAWEAAFEALVASGLPADCPGTTRSGSFAGESATIVEQSCAGMSIVGRSLVHAGRGYYFTTMSPHPDPAIEAIVARLAASIEFID